MRVMRASDGTLTRSKSRRQDQVLKDWQDRMRDQILWEGILLSWHSFCLRYFFSHFHWPRAKKRGEKNLNVNFLSLTSNFLFFLILPPIKRENNLGNFTHVPPFAVYTHHFVFTHLSILSYHNLLYTTLKLLKISFSTLSSVRFKITHWTLPKQNPWSFLICVSSPAYSIRPHEK